MKEKDLYIDDKTHEIILYAEKEDESYAPVLCSSYAVANHLDEFFSMKQKLELTLSQEFREGKISPVYFFMVIQDMGPGDLAKRMGISLRKLKKHFRPEVFSKLDDRKLNKYAVIFGISIDQLKASNLH